MLVAMSSAGKWSRRATSRSQAGCSRQCRIEIWSVSRRTGTRRSALKFALSNQPAESNDLAVHRVVGESAGDLPIPGLLVVRSQGGLEFRQVLLDLPEPLFDILDLGSHGVILPTRSSTHKTYCHPSRGPRNSHRSRSYIRPGSSSPSCKRKYASFSSITFSRPRLRSASCPTRFGLR